jgi:hypothetical protein
VVLADCAPYAASNSASGFGKRTRPYLHADIFPHLLLRRAGRVQNRFKRIRELAFALLPLLHRENEGVFRFPERLGGHRVARADSQRREFRFKRAWHFNAESVSLSDARV